jgi:hypothetical protein
MLSWTVAIFAMICFSTATILILDHDVLMGMYLGGAAAWLLIIWFFLVFACAIEPALGDGGGVRINEMVAFCYSFAVFMLGAAALGPVGFFEQIQTYQDQAARVAVAVDKRIADGGGKDGGSTFVSVPHSVSPEDLSQFISRAATWPIGILAACVEAPNDAGWELSCSRQRRQPDQWIVNIGGYVTSRVPDTKQHEQVMLAMTGRSAVAASDPPTGTVVALTADPPAQRVDPAFSDPAIISGVAYDGVGTYKAWPLFMVHGGLSVPWYVIMLALMGAAVSMMRRVPEYQLAADGGDDSVVPISKGRAREKMVFEVLQLVAAPMIAVVAYNAFTPSDRATTVILGFASGFSSEPVLMAIRAVVDRTLETLKSISPSGGGSPGGGGKQPATGGAGGPTP